MQFKVLLICNDFVETIRGKFYFKNAYTSHEWSSDGINWNSFIKETK
jgi:hypothetical protein